MNEVLEEERPRRKKVPIRRNASWAIVAGGAVAVVLIAAAVIAVVKMVSGFRVPEADWKEFSPPDGSFTILMPAKVKQKPGPLNITMYAAEVKNGKYAFLVGYADISDFELRQVPLQQRFVAGREGMLKSAPKTKLLSEKDITFKGHPGKELEIEVPGKGVMVARLLFIRQQGKHRFFNVLAAGPRYKADSPDVKKFFVSLDIKAAPTPPSGRPRKNEDVPRDDGNPQYERPDPPTTIPFVVDPRLKEAIGKVFLSDLQEFATTSGPQGWSFAKNGKLGNSFVPGAMVKVQGIAYPKGLSMHPPWNGSIRVCYALGKQARTVSGVVALNEDRSYGSPPTRFLVFGDGKLLWRSQSIRSRDSTEEFMIDVGEVDVLELRTYAEDGLVNGAHAVWLDPYVTMKKVPAHPAEQPSPVKPPPSRPPTKPLAQPQERNSAATSTFLRMAASLFAAQEAFIG